MSQQPTPQEFFDLWSKMMSPGSYPGTNLFQVPDSKDLERKLSELAIVEAWLNANLNMVQLTQKTLQYQLAMLKGGEKAQDMMANLGREEEKPADPPNPAAWAWNMMAESMKPPKPAPKRRRKA